jgi:tetratricopeptide (TPR) repeat protein
MFTDRFRNYVFVNNERRRRDDRLSLCIAFVAYFWLVVIMEEPGRTAAIGGLVVLGICMFCLATYYCVSVPQSAAVPSEEGLLYRPVSRRLALASVLAMALLVAMPQVEAAALNRRLRALTRTTPLSPDDYEQIAHDLKIAAQWNIPLPHQTLVRVRDTIKKSALQAPQVAPLAKPANALVNYDRQDPRVAAALKRVSPLAAAELQRGMAPFRTGLTQSNPAELSAALVALTHAIEQSDGNPTFQSWALLFRAITNLTLGNRDAAAADVRTAEALGSLAIPIITLVEGDVLANQTNPEDSRRAIRLLTFALQLSADQPLFYQLLAYEGRCLAYVRLGEYQEAVPDAQEVVALAKGHDVSMQIGYRLMIVSYLGLADYSEALKSAIEYQTRVGGPVAEQWLEMVKRYPQNPQLVWNALYGVVTGRSVSIAVPGAPGSPPSFGR